MLIEKISLEVSEEIEILENLFKAAPEVTEKALNRTMVKLGKWSEVQVLRVMARDLEIRQSKLKEFGRIRTRLASGYKDSKYLVVWIGTDPIGAHNFGRATQRARGVQVGRRAFYQSAFLMKPVNAERSLIFEREENWRHKWRKSKVSGRWMWMGLPIFSHKVPLYNTAIMALRELEPKIFNHFAKVLHQELNYAFKIESRKSNR
ncbi:hypothetical protein [Endozoicomonas atrinae]|uniref:hypothetical protein n=1 Tax=Endozoicomonas atrinae TaxID=1333660 RepID=UPI0008260ACC|nr:hypothetical protein [Endozoicomonas atrinae]